MKVAQKLLRALAVIACGKTYEEVVGRAGECMSAIGRKCREKHLDAVEETYAKQHAERMDPKLMTAVRECLAGKGLSTTKQEKGPHDLMKAAPRDPE